MKRLCVFSVILGFCIVRFKYFCKLAYSSLHSLSFHRSIFLLHVVKVLPHKVVVECCIKAARVEKGPLRPVQLLCDLDSSSLRFHLFYEHLAVILLEAVHKSDASEHFSAALQLLLLQQLHQARNELVVAMCSLGNVLREMQEGGVHIL